MRLGRGPVTQLLLRDYGGLSLGDPGALRAVAAAATALLAPLCALVGMALGAVVARCRRRACGWVLVERRESRWDSDPGWGWGWGWSWGWG